MNEKENFTLESVVHTLGYDESQYYRRVNDPHPAQIAHLFRSAGKLGVDGIYVFERGPESSKNHYIPAPAVYVAEAENENKARQIHRKLWNLCFAPFIIIILPQQIRVYTGFNYSEEKETEGILDNIENLEQLNRLVEELNASTIDTGLVWTSHYAEMLDSNRRVDSRLLENINRLGEALIQKGALKEDLANTLIGKYIYLKYLQDRGILTNEWLQENNIRPENVFSLNATVKELKKLVNALEERFNGKIFPIDFDAEETLKDEHVRWVAAIFSGAKIVDQETTPDIVLQLHLPFKAYDFEYIPVETLSSIYERFIFDRKTKGAVYTPEMLADYVIAETDSVSPLKQGMKILDPACGSGIFLVLIYRFLIEKEMQQRRRKLNAEELLEILETSIYGVEREADACYVAEFSLILTLLNYLEPRDLQNLRFRFPALHNRQIFESDFFTIGSKESDSELRKRNKYFDWIIGNPPWIMLNTDVKKKENASAFAWMNNPVNKKKYPVGDYQIAEAFSWLVSDWLGDNGIAGLILPATSLFNIKALEYRKRFFSENEIIKVTDFANLRETIWGKRGNEKEKYNPSLPPAILIYRPAAAGREKQDIIHYSPFEINRLIHAKNKTWVITINENEIKTMSPYDAETGQALYWKLALWGNHIDRRVIERIKHTFPGTLNELCEEKRWPFFQGPELRYKEDKLKRCDMLKGKKQFAAQSMGKALYRYSLPADALIPIPEDRCYIRRGEETGIKLTAAPHIILSSSWRNFIIYSDQDFVIPPRQIGISAPAGNNENVLDLKALSMYLCSNLVAFTLFFHTPQWGVFRHAKSITISDVREIPVPGFTPRQLDRLARLQEEVAAIEKAEINKLISTLQKNRLPTQHISLNERKDESGLHADPTPAEKKSIEDEISALRKRLQEKIDENVYDILEIPRDIRQAADDFFAYRLPLDSPSKRDLAVRKPTTEQLQLYAREIKDKLDDFLMDEASVRVELIYSDDLIECIVEIAAKSAPIAFPGVRVDKGNNTMARLSAELAGNLRRQISQWVYVRRGLRLFDGPKILMYKPPRIIDWTQTQARLDAGDIIGELVHRNDE
ncbi:MAG: SAM-dependent methyltransferase [Candidatus Aminicenantes bacterium]|nr:SAM-dependent methyltransferase [Candidatus Aminicenantes bacterium]